MSKPVLLWIDLKTLSSSISTIEYFQDYFEVRQIRLLSSYELQLDKTYPAVLCFDYDFPDTGGLNLLKTVRQRYPRIPVLMLTEQHSESLAVWALRVRVWDYLVKPLTEINYRNVVRELSQVIKRKHDLGQCMFEPSSTIELPSEVRRSSRFASRQLFQPAVSYIDGHMAEKLSERQLAALCGMTSLKFSRGFSKAFGMTFQEYLLRLRISEAQRLLQNLKVSIVDVSYSVGFRDQSYFCRVFKRFTGMTPTLFRGAKLKGTNIEESCVEFCDHGESLHLENSFQRRGEDLG